MAVYKRGENWYIDLSLRVRESGSPWGSEFNIKYFTLNPSGTE